jgi:hypothetical protein
MANYVNFVLILSQLANTTGFLAQLQHCSRNKNIIDSDSLPPRGQALATGTRGGQRRGRPCAGDGRARWCLRRQQQPLRPRAGDGRARRQHPKRRCSGASRSGEGDVVRDGYGGGSGGKRRRMLSGVRDQQEVEAEAPGGVAMRWGLKRWGNATTNRTRGAQRKVEA